MSRVLALGGAVGPLIFTIMTIVMAALRPDYDHMASFISELGATGTANAALMRYAGFLPTGGLLAGFGVALGRALPGRVDRMAAGLIALFGVGVFASGILACDAGCPQGSSSLENRIHNIIGPLAFLSITIGIGMLGFRFRRLAAWRGLSPYTIASSIVALVALVGLVRSVEARETTGAWQRAFLATVFLWCAVVGLRLSRHGSAPARQGDV